MASLTLKSPSPPSHPPSPLLPISRISKKKRKSHPPPPPPRSRSRSPIKTRSSRVQNGPIKLCRETPPSDGSGAASDKQIQKKFAEMLGLVLKEISIEECDENISDDLAELLACANTHKYVPNMYKEGLRDGYYTEEQTNKLLGHFLEVVESPSIPYDIPTCKCNAHENINFFTDQYQASFCDLIRTPPRMNNDEGKTFAISLINIILFHVEKTNFSIKPTEQGTKFSVNYFLLDTVTSQRQLFKGWPDFCLTNKSMGAGVVLVSVGEIESKGDCLLQCGIYAAGQFLHTLKKKKIACIAIYKQKLVTIAVCSIDDDDIISFKLVNSISHMDLTQSQGIKDFAGLLIATLDYVNKENLST